MGRVMARRMWDASRPPATPPAGYDAAGGYIGGDTPHVWTVAEWRRLGSLPKLPIYVRSNPGQAGPQTDAFQALEQLYRIGCPRGYATALDLETAVDAGYVSAYWRVMRWAGFRVWVYGSSGSVFKNPACDGYWVADINATSSPHMFAGPDIRATQYALNVPVPGGQIDRSMVKTWSWARRLWGR